MASYGAVAHGTKRRRTEVDSQGRTASSSRHGHGHHHLQGGERTDQPHIPRLDLASLPAQSVHKYLLHFGLIPHQPLEHRHATFPPTVAALRSSSLSGPPMIQRLDRAGRVKSRTVTYEPTSVAAKSYQQHVDEPPTVELTGPPGVEQDPARADERLIELVKRHWEANLTVKEGESLSSFIYGLRKRCKAHN